MARALQLHGLGFFTAQTLIHVRLGVTRASLDKITCYVLP